MKFKWEYIKALVLIGLVVFLYGFSAKRNTKRNLNTISVEFTNGKNLFITKAAVNKLLIVNQQQLAKTSKDSLDLNKLEQKLNQNPMIANAEVFETIKGDLGAVVTQRQPIARVMGKQAFYIDSEGKKMPLSENYSARVPLVSGITTKNIAELFPLLEKIQQDKFLTEQITGIQKKSSGDYVLKLRENDMTINFGQILEIDRKVNNFKAFYKKAYTAKTLNSYSQVNLKFSNQVVCTKKEE